MANKFETIQVSFVLETNVSYDRSFKCYNWSIRMKHQNFHLVDRVLNRGLDATPLKLSGSADTKELAQKQLDEALVAFKANLPNTEVWI